MRSPLVKIIAIITSYLLCSNMHSYAQMTVRKMSTEIDKYVDMAENCVNQYHQDTCIHYYYDAIDACLKSKQSQHLDYLYFNLGRNYFQYSNEPDSVKKYLYSALSLSEKQKDDSTIADVSAMIGNMHLTSGDMDSSMTYFLQAAKYLEKTKDSILLAFTYVNIGSIYNSIKNYTSAKFYLLKAHAILTKKEFIYHRASTAAYIGSAYIELNQLDSATYWARNAVDFADNVSKDAIGFIVGNYVLGYCHVRLGNNDSSLYYLKQSIEEAEAINFHEIRGEALCAYSTVMLRLNNNEGALKSAEEAIQWLQKNKNNNILALAYKNAAMAALRLQQNDKSSNYFNLYFSLQDSIISTEHIKTVNDLNVKYETEKKERLIAEKELEIEKKNAQMRLWLMGGFLLLVGIGLFLTQYRKVQKAKLTQAEKEKENAVLKAWMNGEERERNRISQELHDGVAAMIGAARMNLQAFPHLPQEKQENQLNKVSTILENTHVDVRRIAHNLLPVTLQKEGLIKAVEQFATDVNDTGIIQINVNNNFSHLHLLNQQTQLMLFRIVQELLNNTIKHSSATVATVIFTGTTQELQVEVQDNGKGFSSETEKDSQGLFSIRQRLQALGGAFDINSKEGKGTTAVLKVALSKG